MRYEENAIQAIIGMKMGNPALKLDINVVNRRSKRF